MKRFGFVLAFLLFISFAAHAQDTGSITGTIRDASGGTVPNATVRITNTTGLNLTTTSNSEGEYLAPGLSGGIYDLTIIADGFRTFEAKSIVLRVAQKARIDATLTVGQVDVKVTVQGDDVAQVETQASEVANTLTGKQIDKLQMNGRVFTSLVGLQPGVADPTEGDEAHTGSLSGVSTSINGGRSENNNWQINGGDNQDTGSNGTLVVYPNVDAIAEVRILESSYGAQYGKNGAGTIEIDTKSGTSKFHGDLFYFGRNEALNAYGYLDDHTAPKPSYKKHDFGYTVGGPVYLPRVYNKNKTKTFFFWAQEWRREKVPNLFRTQVPSEAERGGNFSDQCTAVSFGTCPAQPGTPNPYPGNVVPIDPNSLLLLALIPHANSTQLDGSGRSIPFFIKSVPQSTTTREELLKIDHNITSKVRAMFSYIHDSFAQEAPGAPGWSQGSAPTFGSNREGPGISMVARVSAEITPTLFNEFVASYTSNRLTFGTTGPYQRSGYPGLFTNGLFANQAPPFGGKVSGVSITDNSTRSDAQGRAGTTSGTFTIDPAFAPWTNTNPTYSFRDNVSKMLGKHSLQFGAYFQASQKNEPNQAETEGLLSFNNQGSTVTTGNGFADFLTGRIANFAQVSSQIKYYQRYKVFEPYFQDDWRVTSRLTLNLGLRISVFGTFRERYHQAYNFDPTVFSAAKAPVVDPNSGALVAGSGNPFDGMVQCGGAGGVSASVPGFPNAATGANPYAGCLKGHLFNPAPRIGFAYDPWGDGKTAIRGGYGIFYEHTNGTEGNTGGLEGNPPQVLPANQSNIPGYASIGGGGGSVQIFPFTPVSIPGAVKWPYMQQWHLDVQRQVPGKIVVSLAYVASKGTNLTTQRDLNQLAALPLSQNPFAPGQTLVSTGACGSGPGPNGTWQPGNTVTGTTMPLTNQAAINLNVACGVDPTVAGYRPFQALGSIYRFENSASSIYHSLQFGARRTVGDLSFSLAYTYSHSIDNASTRSDSGVVDSYHPDQARASSNFDQRHILNTSFVYDLPLFKGSGLTHTLLGGWEVSGIAIFQSGQPFSVTYGNDNGGVRNGIGLGSFLDLVGDPNAPPATKRVNGLPVLYNPAAFARPRALTFGSSGRNRLNYPFRTNFDLGLFKSFRVRESQSVEFRIEAFNIFNHPQFNSVSTTFGDPLFLTPNGVHAGRIGQYSLKYIF